MLSLRSDAARGAALALLLLSFSASACADDLADERWLLKNILDAVAKDIRNNFYDPNLKGLDWTTLTDEARRRIDDAKSVNEMFLAVSSLVNQLQDSHTLFLPPGRLASPSFGFLAKPVGDQILVYAVKHKGPAAAAGLLPGDRILAISQIPVQRDSYDLTMLESQVVRPRSELVMRFARGNQPPASIRIAAQLRPNKTILTDVSGVQAGLNQPDARATSHCRLFDDGVVYMQVPGFHVRELPFPHRVQAQPRALIVDLRNNSGGRHDALLEFAGHFVAEPSSMGSIVRRQKTEPLNVKPQKPNFAKLPLVILIDSETSSAAEMFARHMQANRRAVLLGDHSAGRVNASRLYPREIGAYEVVRFGTQISAGKIVMSNGEELEKRGVTPDVACLPSGEDLREGRDPCLLQAVAIARNKAGLGEQLPDKTKADVNNLANSMKADFEKEYNRN